MCRRPGISLTLFRVSICIPYCIRNRILVNFPEWFRNGSGIQFWWIFWNGSGMVPEAFHVSPEDIFDEDSIPSVLSAKISVSLSVLLTSYFGGQSECLEEYFGSLHILFLGIPENIRICSGYGCRTESISVVVVTIWLWVMA